MELTARNATAIAQYAILEELIGHDPEAIHQHYVSVGEDALRKTCECAPVHFPTTDGRWLIFCRYTSPNKLQKLLIGQLGLQLPAQSPPRITSRRSLEPLSSQTRL